MAERPQVNLTFERALCARHGEPFRARWPKGYPIFMVKAFQVVASKEEVAAAVEGDIRGIEALLDERPMCERVTRDELLELYRESDIGITAYCENCRRTALGTPYKTSTPSGVHEAGHICFECTLDWMRPLQ